jgi:hypothetical protein
MMTRALGLGLIMTAFTGCVGLWGPDVPRPVIYFEPAPIVVEPVIVVPVYPSYHYRYYR